MKKDTDFATFFLLFFKVDAEVREIFTLGSCVATQVPESLMVFVLNALKEERGLKVPELCVCVMKFAMQQCL